MCAHLAQFKVGHRWKRATPPRVLEQFIRTKRSPRERDSHTQPRHQPGRTCLVTEVWPPPRNVRGPRAFSGNSFGPIEFPVAHCRRAGCHPNARSARVFPSGSPLETRDFPAHFGVVHSDKTIASRAGFSHVTPPPTWGACLVIAVLHLSGNARGHSIFSGGSFKPIELATHESRTG